eukprot:3577443-Alexandrium_andersonii.AAC.1
MGWRRDAVWSVHEVSHPGGWTAGRALLWPFLPALWTAGCEQGHARCAVPRSGRRCCGLPTRTRR